MTVLPITIAHQGFISTPYARLDAIAAQTGDSDVTAAPTHRQRRNSRSRRQGRVARCCVGLAATGAAAPLAAAGVLWLSPPADAAAAAALVIGAAVAGIAATAGVALLLRPLADVASAFDAFAVGEPAPRGRDEFARIARGVRALEGRLEHAARKADPARLEDPLTGLPNRLAVMRRARDEIARARRRMLGLSVALVEIDGFEAIASDPDRAIADRVLRITGETMVQALRAYDLVGRWSGAAFVAVLPEAEVENAVDAIRRVRDRLADEPAARAGGHTLTVSAGVAVLQPDDATLADIVTRAEAALKKAQGRGAGMVEAAPGPRTRPGRLTSI